MKLNQKSLLIRIGFAVVLLSPVSCSTWRKLNYTEKGAATGGALGAGTGAIIGSQVGAGGAGVAIGTGIGALAGGLVGQGLDEVSGRQATLEERQRRQSAQIKAQKAEIDQLKKQNM